MFGAPKKLQMARNGPVTGIWLIEDLTDIEIPSEINPPLPYFINIEEI